MKKFTKKLKTKIGALIGCVSAFVLALGFGIASLPEKSLVGKATDSPTVTNVEDLITSDALTGTGASLSVREGNTGAELTIGWNDKQTVTKNSGYIDYELYNTKADVDSTTNGNAYAGNISMYSYTDYSSYIDVMTANFLNSSTDQIVSFRTKYTTNEIALAMRMTPKGNLQWGDSVAEGYAFFLNKQTNTSGRYDVVKSVGTSRDTSFINSAGETKSSAGAAFTKVPDVGNELIVTYGCYSTTYNEKATVALCLKIENVTKSETVIDTIWYDDNPDDTKYSAGKGEANKGGKFIIASHFNGGKPQVIGGVEHPIFMETKTYQAEKSYALNTPLSTVQADLAETGFALTNTTGNLSVGAVAYDGTYAAEYYGETIDYPAKITVNSGITNIETLVDYNIEGSTKFSINDGQNGGKLTQWNTPTNIVSGSDSTKILDTAYVYNTKAEDGSTTNANDYAGNISMYSQKVNGSKNMVLVNLVGDYSDQIVSFRTNYTNNQILLGMRMAQNDADQYSERKTGYFFTLNCGALNKYMVGKGIGTGRDYEHVKGSTGATIKTSESRQAIDGLTVGDDIIITYGCYNTTYSDADAVALYLKIEKSDGTVVVNETWYDTEPTTTSTAGTGLKIYSLFTTEVPMTVGGVERPLYEQCYAYEDEVSGEADATLSTVQLASGYEWKEPDTVITAGTTKYAAAYSMEYYGKTIEMDVTVTMQVTTKGITTLIFKSASGDVLIEKEIEQGNTYSFEKGNTENTFIGWKGSDGLYPTGYEFTATASTDTVIEYTLEEVDMFFEEGAAVRLINKTDDVPYYGGLRFTLAVNSDTASTYINALYAWVVPYDTEYYTNGAFTETAILKAEENNQGKLEETHTYSKSGFDGYTLYGITLTNIQYSNYNRDFVGMAYIVVEYANGTTDKVQIAINETDNVRSVHTVATKVYAKHLARENANNGVGIYNDDQVNILKDYVFGVVDLTLTGTTLAVVEDQDGLGGEKPYELSSQSVTDSDTDGTYEVQISVKITVDETLYQGNADELPHIPVTVRMLNGNGQVVAVVRAKQTVTAYQDGVATITFEITPLTEQ